MILRFGLELQEQVYPQWELYKGKPVLACGERGLLQHCEQQLGLLYPDLQDYLRQEQYRQLMQVYLQSKPTCFYARSFEADALGAAQVLLARRDELYLAGWNFALSEDMPLRLQVLAELEELLQSGRVCRLQAGKAERWLRVLENLEQYEQSPFEQIYLNEPLDLIPGYLQKILKSLETRGCQLIPASPARKPETGNRVLDYWQLALQRLAKEEDKPTEIDESLCILRAKNENDLAVFLAQLMRENPSYRPLCLLSAKNRSLDQALIEEGLPSMGLPSASLARPTLQVLRLATAFLWNPVDPYKILEFVSLPNKPLHKELSELIAGLIAKKPGLFSGTWMAAIREFFARRRSRIAELSDARRAKELEIELDEAEKQYKFWFQRSRFDPQKGCSAKVAIELFDYLRRWALSQSEEQKNQIDKIDKRLAKQKLDEEQSQTLEKQREELVKAQPPMQALGIQASRIVELLHALPPQDKQLNALQLERLIRSFNEPTALQWQEAQIGHLPYVFSSSALTQEVEELLCWNFIEEQTTTGFARWYPREFAYLKDQGLQLENPDTENRRRLWQSKRALLLCKERLILCISETVAGQGVQANRLLGELEAALGEDMLKKLTVHIGNEEEEKRLRALFKIPRRQEIQPLKLHRTIPYINISQGKAMQAREVEHYSSLDNLLYYPYRWVFQYQIHLHPAPILSVTKAERLFGNLAHLVFEDLLGQVKEQENRRWNRTELDAWLEERMPRLFEQEGSILLLYGEEPKRINFQKKLRHAAWQLLSNIQINGWKILGVEQQVEGMLAEQKIMGIADIILERGNERTIIDLKWGSSKRHLESLNNYDNLQLILYSKMAAAEGQGWAHTAYFIISEGKFLAHNKDAIKIAETPPGEILDYKQQYANTWKRIEATFLWRCRQLEQGRIEVCTSHTTQLISKDIEEELSPAELMALLEMQGREDARFDPYRVLVQPAGG